MASLNSRSIVIRSTIVNGTAAYASGDQLGAAVALTGWQVATATCNVMHITVTYLSGYASAIDLHYFDSSPTVVADNAAGTFTVANMTSNYLGKVSFAATDFTTVGGHYTATLRSVGLTLQATNGTVYCDALIGGTPTYIAASHVIVTHGLLQDG